MSTLTVREAAEILNAKIVGELEGEGRSLSSVVADSRQVAPGSLFVALKGQKHDGHDFVLEAFSRGARAALVERVPGAASEETARSLPMILVPDTLTALQELARGWHRRLGLTVVGITGSVGKTTTKEVMAGILGLRYRVLRNEGNLNTEIGLPLTLLQATPQHQVIVLEMGMYALGEIRALARLAEPQVGVVTNVGPTHLERLGSIERIAEAKSELVDELPADGLAVLNYDDHRVRAMRVLARGEVLYYGLDQAAEVRAENIHSRGLQGVQFDLLLKDSMVHVPMPLLGLHSVHAALAGAAVASHLGMSAEEIAEGLHRVSPTLRLIVEAGVNGSTVIDDTYNASPASVLAALNLLSELEGRKVAVLGDMLELGTFSEEGHRMVGRRAADVVDIVVAVGQMGSIIGLEAMESGKAQDQVFLAQNNEEAVQRLKAVLRPGDCVLVKGSRGMHMEEIVEAIRCPTP